jgi:Xaa-Pro aminopeptidase
MNKKLAILKRLFKDYNENFLFLDFEDPNHTWLLGRKLENSFIIIKRTGKPMLFMSPLEKYEDPNFMIKPIKKEDFPSKVLVNKDFFKIKYQEFFDFKEIEIIVRDVKDDVEILLIKKACGFTDKCFSLILEGFKKNKYKTEKDVEKEITLFALNNELDLAFPPIIASGKNSAIPHHDNNGKLTKGFCVIDFGFKYKEYCSDMTRTIYIGKPTKKELELYETLLKLQIEAISKAKPKTKAKELDSFVRSNLKENEKYFIHSLGHGLGVQIHESPSLSQKSEDILKQNQVITIEPGIYDKQGIRIEDTILVDDNPKILTKSSKELFITNL